MSRGHHSFVSNLYIAFIKRTIYTNVSHQIMITIVGIIIDLKTGKSRRPFQTASMLKWFKIWWRAREISVRLNGNCEINDQTDIMYWTNREKWMHNCFVIYSHSDMYLVYQRIYREYTHLLKGDIYIGPSAVAVQSIHEIGCCFFFPCPTNISVCGKRVQQIEIFA